MSYGSFPYRRTFKHLGDIPFRFHPDVRVMLVNYHNAELNSRGLLKFIYERVPQLQYGHPDVQIIRQGNEPHKPLPYIEVFFHDGKRVFIDCENKRMKTIVDTLESVTGDIFNEFPDKELKPGAELHKDPADFIWHRGRKCICETPGQSPCSVKGMRMNRELVYANALSTIRTENKANQPTAV